MEDDAQINWKERYFELLKKFEALEAEVKSLKEQLATNSNNSSKSPSQDPYRKAKNSTPSGRKQGGQPGHLGHSRKFVPPNQVTKVIDLLPLDCPICSGAKLSPDPISTERRQVTELPMLSI